MGLFGNRIMRNVRKIYNGGTAKLSVADISNVIINLFDAKRNLTPEQFSGVHVMYKKCQEKTEMRLLDKDAYLETALNLILEFDKAAPYEYYSGGQTQQWASALNTLREEEQAKRKNNYQFLLICLYEEECTDKHRGYVSYLRKSCPTLTLPQAKAFMGILILNDIKGTDYSLKAFDKLINCWISNLSADELQSMVLSVPFCCGTLSSNRVISQAQSDSLSKQYCDSITNAIIEKDKL